MRWTPPLLTYILNFPVSPPPTCTLLNGIALRGSFNAQWCYRLLWLLHSKRYLSCWKGCIFQRNKCEILISAFLHPQTNSCQIQRECRFPVNEVSVDLWSNTIAMEWSFPYIQSYWPARLLEVLQQIRERMEAIAKGIVSHHWSYYCIYDSNIGHSVETRSAQNRPKTWKMQLDVGSWQTLAHKCLV